MSKQLYLVYLALIVAVIQIINITEGNPLNSNTNIEFILRENEKNSLVVDETKWDKNDADLDVPQLITKYGYPVEVHEITTGDGYILTVHRIPYGKESGPGKNKPVVWLQHGLLGDSCNWIINSEDKALAYILANAGYDVWLGNARGNRYSKKHVSLPVESADFWNFSWNEMGIYDIPAVIDYVLEKTGEKDLYYVGHSMGTTMFFVAMAERPEYNSKIRLMSAFAPVSYIEHLSSPIKLLAPLSKVLEDILRFLGANEFLSNADTSAVLNFLGAIFCREAGGTDEMCNNILFLLVGIGTDQLDKGMIPILLGHMPAGSSTRAVVHYAQGINDGYFRKFDHGKKKNQEIYGQDTPPHYDISKIICPIALYWGENDGFAHKTDVHRLASELPNLVRKYRVNHDKFNHLDFIWAMENTRLLSNPFIEFLQYF